MAACPRGLNAWPRPLRSTIWCRLQRWSQVGSKPCPPVPKQVQKESNVAQAGQRLLGAEHGVSSIETTDSSKRLGAGVLGVVTEAWLGGLQVAKKTVENQPFISELEEEARILRVVGPHPNIVQVLDFHLQTGRAELLLEFLGDNLQQALAANPEVSLAGLLQASTSLLAGVSHLRAMFVTHSDIRQQNICLKPATAWCCVLVGFDCAKQLASLDDRVSGGIGLSLWSGEAVGNINPFRQDIYGTGCMLSNIRGRVAEVPQTLSEIIGTMCLTEQDRPTALQAYEKLQAVATDALRELAGSVHILGPKRLNK